MTTGEKIQRLRKSHGMSQEELAALIAVSRQAVSKWELDGALPDTDKMIQLGRIFNVTTDYLFLDEVTEEHLPPTASPEERPIKKKSRTEKIALIVFLTAVALYGLVVGLLSQSISIAILMPLSVLSLAVIIYVVYLLIAFLRRNTR